MRERKYRAWDKTNKKMWYSSQYGNSLGEFFINHNARDDTKIMDWIGLKDKNEKEIYEEDIVVEYPGFGCEWKPRKGYVKYSGASFWLEFENCSHILDDHDCTLEVIGNIYENPDLLKENG